MLDALLTVPPKDNPTFVIRFVCESVFRSLFYLQNATKTQNYHFQIIS